MNHYDSIVRVQMGINFAFYFHKQNILPTPPLPVSFLPILQRSLNTRLDF